MVVNHRRKVEQMKQLTRISNDAARKALGELTLGDIENRLQEGARVSIMLGQLDLKNGDRAAAWIGTALATVRGHFKFAISVRDVPGLIQVGLELSRRIWRIEKEGHPYGAEMGVKELGSKSPFRGICPTEDATCKGALAAATAVMESFLWSPKRNLWPIYIPVTDRNTMMGFLGGYGMFPHDEEGRPLSVDAAVAFLGHGGGKSCGYIRSFKREVMAMGLTPPPKPVWCD